MKKLKVKRILSLLTVIVIVFLSSCNMDGKTGVQGGINADDNPGISEVNNETQATDGKSSIITERSKFSDNIEDEDMEGMQFRILVRDQLSKEFFIEEETGDIIEDAVYLRNKKIEDRFNIELKSILSALPSNETAKIVKAGDDAFDLIADNMVFLASSALTKPYLDFNAISTINLDQVWFLQDAIGELSVNNCIYILPGEACSTILEAAYCYYFNKGMIAKYGLENPYQLVLEGKWTLDKFGEMIKGLYKDIDGDGKKTLGDFYGFSTFNLSHAVTYTYSSGMRITKTNADGIPEFVVPNEKVYSNFEKVFKLVCNNPDTYGATLAEQQAARDLFTNNQAVFVTETIDGTRMFRDMEDDFGIVPFPKYDEAQEKYYTFSDGYASMMAVPITVLNTERIGKVITALNAESWKTVIPQYYDIAIKVKFVRDDESVQVLDMLLDGRVFDFGYIYDDWKGYGFYMWDLIAADNDNIASYFEKRKSSADKNLEKVLRTFED